MTDNKAEKNTARRRLLKSVVAGGGVLATGKLLPENWFRPVVRSVVLPAHAQTSPPVSFDGLYVFEGPAIGDALDSQPGSILDMFVSPAHAVVLPVSCEAISQIQIDITGGNAEICVRYGGNNYPGSTSVNQSTGALAPAAVSTVFGVTVDLIDMQVAPDGEAVNGVVDECSPFVATKSGGSFSCPNLTNSVYLSSPFADKA